MLKDEDFKALYPQIVIENGRYYLRLAEARQREVQPPKDAVLIAQQAEGLVPGERAEFYLALLKLHHARDRRLEAYILELREEAAGGRTSSPPDVIRLPI